LTESKVEFRPKGSTEPAVQIALRDVLDVASSHEVVRDHSLWLKVGLTPTPTAMLAKRVRERIMGHRAMAIRTESETHWFDQVGQLRTWTKGGGKPEVIHAFVEAIDQRRQALQRQTSAGRRETAPGVKEIAQELRELASLRDEGLITEEEYEAKRKQLSDRL